MEPLDSIPPCSSQSASQPGALGLLVKRVAVFAASLFLTGTVLNLISIYVLHHYSRYLRQTIELLLASGGELIVMLIAAGLLLAVAVPRVRRQGASTSLPALLFIIGGAGVALAFWLPPTLDIVLRKPPLDQWGTPNPTAAGLGVSWGLVVLLSVLAGWLTTRRRSHNAYASTGAARKGATASSR